MRHKVTLIKTISLFITLMVTTISSYGQQQDSWKAFFNESSDLIGFKDSLGEVKIAPKFMGFTSARKFDDIIAVMEQQGEQYISYYLTKSGQISGRDSLFISDNSADCESEGFIRFQNHETGNTGMLNSKGEVVIPAEYNALSRVRNGYVIALKDAKKSFWDKIKHSGCHHYSWKGGKTQLIDTSNQVVIKKFKNENFLDFYSLQKTAKSQSDPNRETHLATDGQYYSFVDFKKAFQYWLFDELLESLTVEKLTKASYKKIYYSKDNEVGISQPKEAYIAEHFDLVKNRLEELKKEGTDYFISAGGLNMYDFKISEFETYFNNCREAKDWKFPLMTVIINHGKDNNSYQDQISFLKTDEGYQLIQLTLRNKE